MRKWTYLVAALLMGGVSTSLTSCIDNDEPAGINDLRGAKAELLRAKAAVENAEAAIKTATAAIKQAKADYAQEKVAQEKLYTDWLTAKYEDDKTALQQDAAIREQAYLQKLYQAQSAAKQAELDYQRALAQIEIALGTAKDDAYAEALQDLLYNKTFTIPSYQISVNPVTHEVTINLTGGSTTTIYGLMNLSQQLANAKQELAEAIQQNLILGYKFDKDALKNDVAVTVEVKKAELAVEEKALAELKEIIGISLDDFEAKYQEIADKKKEAENNKTNVSIEKAKDLAENYDGKAQELKNKKEAQSEFTFDIPAAVQNDFYNIVASKAGSATGDEVAIYQNILKQATADAEGEYAFTNGMKVNTTAAIKKSIINAVKGDVEEKAQAQDVAQLEQAMKLAEDAETELKKSFDAAEKTWKAAAAAYDKAKKADKYHITGQSEYDVVQGAVETYNNSDKSAADQTALINAYKKYLNGDGTLEGRTKLDGFKPADNINIATATADNLSARLTAFLSATDTDRFGDSTPTMNGGYYKALTEAADDFGVDVDQRTAYTYEEWTAAQEEAITLPEATSGTATFNYFTAMDKHAEAVKAYEDAANVADWVTLLANIEKVEDAVLAETNALQLEEADLEKVKAEIEAKYEVQEATYQAEINSYKGILDAMAAAVPDVSGLGSITTANYDQAIANLKAEIAEYESADLNEDTGEITLGTISAKKQEVALYENLLAGLEDESYQTAEEILKDYNDAMIEAYNMKIEVLQVLFDKANAQKDSYMEALTSGSSSTPVEPETPAE
ncbi:hypothetical protein [Phocaeicola coprophilus]|uniref:hypothetical protein n=1 Tax=Phocaeicola coprophilus TaxID=387090 RepID=UPI00266C9621|nr:hypothetical protein [Phocaeicola coprophilus]